MKASRRLQHLTVNPIQQGPKAFLNEGTYYRLDLIKIVKTGGTIKDKVLERAKVYTAQQLHAYWGYTDESLTDETPCATVEFVDGTQTIVRMNDDPNNAYKIIVKYLTGRN
jgi:hypothetical protein